MDNPKATTLINRLTNLKKDVISCGILSEKISPEQHHILDNLSHFFTREFWVLPTQANLHLDRLQAFVNHLKTAKLIHPFKFNESSYFSEYGILFPDAWDSVSDNTGSSSVVYKKLQCCSYDGERFFFGLSKQQHDHLFFEYNQNPEWGNIKMTGRTGKVKFIENMEQFIAYFEKGGRQC